MRPRREALNASCCFDGPQPNPASQEIALPEPIQPPFPSSVPAITNELFNNLVQQVLALIVIVQEM